MKILIVDDNIDDRLLIRRIIQKHGHDAKEAEDGQDGLEKAVIYKPDLIISDILMPHVDGYQFLRNIKNNAVLKSIPFIFYSAIYTEQKDMELATSLGATAFIPGPKDPDEFWRGVESILRNRGTKGTPGEEKMLGDEVYFLINYSLVLVENL